MRVRYAKEFGVVDIEREIETLERLQSLVNSPTYFKQKAMQIIKSDLNTTNADDLSKIASEIEDAMREGS